MAVALAFLQPCTARAQSPGDSRADQAICSTVARIVLAAKPSGGWRSAWQQPLSVLAKASNGVVSIDAEGWRAKTKEEALDRLRDKYRATPSLTAAVGELIDGGDISTLHRFGSSSLNLAKTVGGTARCENFVFFDAPPAGAAHAVAAPPIVQNAEPFTFCVRTTGYAGEVSGVPAFVVETDQDSTVDLSFTPWRDSGWQRQCKVAIRFSDVFAMTDRFCKDVDCNGLAEQALAITRKVDQSPQATSDDANDQDDKFKALKKLADDRPPDVQLPTFGGQIHGLFGNYDGFAEDSVFLPIIIGGETYLGRVGHGAIGWRKVPDYLFAAYKKVGDSLEPVAGFYISKTRGEPLSATVE
ncbi:MAG: hypothetical protein ACXWK3_10390 [Reyranella sp.]